MPLLLASSNFCSSPRSRTWGVRVSGRQRFRTSVHVTNAAKVRAEAVQDVPHLTVSDARASTASNLFTAAPGPPATPPAPTATTPASRSAPSATTSTSAVSTATASPTPVASTGAVSAQTTTPTPAPTTTPTPTLPPAISNGNGSTPHVTTASKKKQKKSNNNGSSGPSPKATPGPILMITKPLPSVLLLHTGGTLGMDAEASFELDQEGAVHLKHGTGGSYQKTQALRPGEMLSNILSVVPELRAFANIDLKVVYNKDSSRVGPKEWSQLAKILHQARQHFDAFLVVHGTDTMGYTASALSLMLAGFRKPIVMTGSQLPLAMPRSDARQNLIDSITCATSFFTPPHIALQEVAICFGGKLMRGNRCQKVNSSSYQAFESRSYPPLAQLGVEVDWNERFLLRPEGVYRPRFNLNPAVIRIPIVPGCDPRMAYGDLVGHGVRGVVLEAFGVGNMPDHQEAGWMPWLKSQCKKGLQVYLASQCTLGPLHPELYRSGSVALQLGVEAGPQMTPECAVVKMMQCLAYPDIPLGVPIAGEM